jgi:taurine dioxygenase
MNKPLASGKLETRPKDFSPRLISVAPLTPVCGAEITGVDLSTPIPDAVFSEIHQAFALHHVLVFRDQVLSDEDHKAFCRRFGPLHVHPYHGARKAPADKAGAVDAGKFADPEILVVATDKDSKYTAGEAWHADVTCDEKPPMASALYITKTPEIGGGDTLFLNCGRAFDTLSPRMKAFISELSAVHDGAKPYSGAYGMAPPEGGWPRATHPVVISHPVTGEQILYVNSGFTTRIQDLAKDESEALLAFLIRHIESDPTCQCRVRWTPNTLVLWDNLAVQHHAVWDYYPYSRYGKRVSIVGDRPKA